MNVVTSAAVGYLCRHHTPGWYLHGMPMRGIRGGSGAEKPREAAAGPRQMELF